VHVNLRVGDVVCPFRMPKMAPLVNQAEKGTAKKSKPEDPASTGSGKASTPCNRKYSETPSVHSKFFVEKIVCGTNTSLIEASYTKATWAKHCSAINSLKRFESQNGIISSWPLTLESLCEYTAWALTDGKLKPDTVRSYLCSIKLAHELKNLAFAGNHVVIKTMLKGADNLSLYNVWNLSQRKAMTLALLKIIGHQIANSEWSKNSKMVVWTACVVAFFGSFRFGEILPTSESSYCEAETLLWKDLKFRKDNSVLIHIKIDKCRNRQGSYVDLFEFKGHHCCPIKCLKALYTENFCSSNPVFQFSSGKNLSAKLLNRILYDLLHPVIGSKANDVTGHSFRAGLPSAMASYPDLANDKDIKAWGRWSSDSYLLYTRLKLNQKKCLFTKIVSVLDK
jgi:hypothetical protein